MTFHVMFSPMILASINTLAHTFSLEISKDHGIKLEFATMKVANKCLFQGQDTY